MAAKPAFRVAGARTVLGLSGITVYGNNLTATINVVCAATSNRSVDLEHSCLLVTGALP